MKLSKSNEYSALLFGVVLLFILLELSSAMSADEKKAAKEKVVSMFYHAYNAYMNNAYPADELMPLSCKGRYRGTEQPRGDVDDTLGNFTLTLIDSADTLAVLGDVEGFEEAVRTIIRDSRFDCDVIVSVFETNIRILGGLLGGHVMAAYFKRRGLGLSWYNNELLSRAKEVGDRLLPAFNTSTGIPYPRVNLKHGIVSHITNSHRDTCTACAGSMILEFAALSRLTGLPIYEEKARKAMDYLWHQRHRGSDLMGSIINVHSGDWVRRESGVGAGIDSYYEYVLKAYILLGDDNYLDRFNKHYDAVMRYVSQGPLLMDVHMHKPNSISRNFMDALLAFWPGLQVLKGDLVPAIETHEMLYQVMQRHNFIPEAFTSDFRIHWGHHPLRPEFIESTYFLYKATGDNYYLEAGKKVLDNLEAHAKVPCGLAAIKNVKTGAHEDQMDSYVLAEMFKYLYLLFAEREDLIFDIDDFIFTTEAHLLPLTLSMGNSTPALPKIRREAYNFEVNISPPVSDNFVTALNEAEGLKKGSEPGPEEETDDNGDHVCPALHTTHASGRHYPHAVRSLIKDIVNRVSPQQKKYRRKTGKKSRSSGALKLKTFSPMDVSLRFGTSTRFSLDEQSVRQALRVRKESRVPRLKAMDFIAGNKEQLEQLHAMGIRIATMADGRIQLLHTASEAHSPEDAEDGMQFMQEMIELSKHQQPEAQHDPMFLHVTIPGLPDRKVIRAGPAQFGYDLREGKPVTGMLAIARPFRACKEIENPYELTGHVAILERGDCMFVDKARYLQRIGARGGIVIDHTEGSTSESQPLFAMSGDGTNDVKIPMLFLYHAQGQQLLRMLEDNSFLRVTLTSSPETPPSFDQQVDAILASGGSKRTAPQAHQTDPTPDLSSAREEFLVRWEQKEKLDSFTEHINDKFYHHEAQLRDLYYLQVGSRYMHVNMEVRPAPPSKPLVPLERREDVFSMDVLPDQSKMLTVRLSYQLPPGEGYDKQKPLLNQMYVDLVHLVQLHTNFNELDHTTDYLRALAYALEAGYSGINRVDPDVLTLMRSLSRLLKDVHHYPDQPDRPVVSSTAKQEEAGQGQAQGQSQTQSQGQAQDQGQSGGEKSSAATSGGSPTESYASAEDFTEESSSQKSSPGLASTSSAQGVSRGSEGTAAGGGDQFVRFVEHEDGQPDYGAHVTEEGRLEFVQKAEKKQDEGPVSQQQQNTFSAQVKADGERAGDSGEKKVVQMKDEDNHVSQSQSFSVGDSQSQDSSSSSDSSSSTSSHSSSVSKEGGGVSETDQSLTSSSSSQSDYSGSVISQSGVSGSSHSQSDSRASRSDGSENGPGFAEQPVSAGRGLDRTDGGHKAQQSRTAGSSEGDQVTESGERHQQPSDEL